MSALSNWRSYDFYASARQYFANINVTHHTKRDLMGIAKSIEPGQPAQSAQADHGLNLSPLADFLFQVIILPN